MSPLAKALTFSRQDEALADLKRKQNREALSLAFSMAKPAIAASFGSIIIMLAFAFSI